MENDIFLWSFFKIIPEIGMVFRQKSIISATLQLDIYEFNC